MLVGEESFVPVRICHQGSDKRPPRKHREMARRNAIRRAKNLDEEQTQEAMKVLEKFCKKKYRNSVLISQADLTDIDEVVQRPASIFFGSRQSTTFSVLPEGRGAISPGIVSVDFSEPTIKEEIKYDSRKESLWHYTSRVIRLFYDYFALKHIVAIVLLIAYALIGGLIFMHIERPEQLFEMEENTKITNDRRTRFSSMILQELVESECLERLINSTRMTLQLEHSNSLCQHKIQQLLKIYDEQFAEDHGISEAWTWDYWNAVFYAGTVFTTIGYGNLSCKTVWGRVITIIYAIIGIPMTLFIVNMLGIALFGQLKARWHSVIRRIRSLFSLIRQRLRRSELKRTPTIESVMSSEVAETLKNENTNSDDDDEMQESVPMTVAILGTFIFMILCSVLFSLWEEWDLFTSFYFTFISMSTIGFGDVIPQHPKYACVLFLFYFIGLWLVSVVIAVIQARVENKYMWALQLIDQEREVADEYQVNPQAAPSTDNLNENIRWRGESGGYRDALSSPPSMIIANHGEEPMSIPPVLNTFLSRSSVKRNPLERSESRSSFSTRVRQFSNSTSMSELLTPVDNRNRAFPGMEHGLGMQAGRSAGSMSSLAQRNLNLTVPLSVISEVSDEETLHSRKSTKPRRDLRDFFKRRVSSSTSALSDTDAEVSALCTPLEDDEEKMAMDNEGETVEQPSEPQEIETETQIEPPTSPFPDLKRPDTLNLHK